jgi:hypothetical protein
VPPWPGPGFGRCDCFLSVNAVVPFAKGFYVEDGAQFISQTGPQADLGEQGPERVAAPQKRDGDPPKTGSKSSKVKTELN